jgi:NADH-quinone oxidoreductase subunit H
MMGPLSAAALLQAGGPIRQLLSELLGPLLPPAIAEPAAAVGEWLILAIVILTVVQVVMLYITWVERKFVGRIQDRLGPNRVGKFGLAQPFADMIKMLTKEDITPTAAHRQVYNLGAMLVVPPAILVFAVIPLSFNAIPADLSVGFLYFVAVAGTVVIPLFMAGWGSRNKYALLGAMRAVAQIVSYEIPQVLCVVGVLLLAGTLSMQGITVSQGPLLANGQPPPPGAAGPYPGVWYLWLQPIAFVIFLLATTAELERTPFDIPEAESEIIAGYHTEYSGLKFGLFYLGLYFALIASSALATVMFLGGWQPPLAQLAFIPGWIWFSAKTFLVVLAFMWFRATWPRVRVDQLMGFAWKVLVPLALANLLVAGLVGKVTYDIRAGLLEQGPAAAASFQASPWFVFLGFTLGNALLIAATLGALGWWQGRERRRALVFESAGEGSVA